MQQGKAKIRLLAAATLGMARLLFLGGLVLLLNFAMIRLAISVCDARDNTSRASFGLKSKEFEYFHTGIYPFSGSAFINADRFFPKSFEISTAPLDSSNDLSQAPDPAPTTTQPIVAPKSMVEAQDYGSAIVSAAICIYFVFLFLMWGWILVRFEKCVAKIKFLSGGSRSFFSAWFLSSLTLTLVGFLASLF